MGHLKVARSLDRLLSIDRLDPQLYFMSDEAWFHLSEYVSSQNTRYWSSENPHVIHKTPSHDLKIGVWCAVSRTKIVGPIFFESTLNTDVHILEQFNDQLTPQDKMQFFFRQDGATYHTSHRSLTRAHDMFTEERTISKELWLPRSPDLSVCNFYLWGTLKQKVYANNPHNLDQLKENITNAIRRITREELQAVSANVVKRAQKCIDVSGEYFQHLL